jgi:PAS domain S-box-containing protein
VVDAEDRLPAQDLILAQTDAPRIYLSEAPMPQCKKPEGPAPARFEERYRLLVESVQDYALVMLDPEGTVVSWNLGAERIKGYTADEIIGRPFSVFYPPEAVQAGWPQTVLRRALSEGRFEDEDWRVRKDGSRFWANIILTAMFAEDGSVRGFAKVTRDLSERREHEERLRQSEEQFKLLVQSVTDYAIFMLDTAGNVRSWNAGAAAIKGYTAGEIIGRHFSTFYRAEDIALGIPANVLRRALQEGHAIEQGWRVRKDGSVFWADVTVTPLFDASGVPRGYAKITRDATERRRLMELETSTRRLTEFLATLGHELRNPMTPIRNSVYLLRMSPEKAAVRQRSLDILERQTEHLTRLVDDLLDIGRITTGKMQLKLQRTDLVELVRRTAETRYPEIAAKEQALELVLPKHPIVVRADTTRLVQALDNLLGNASKFTPNGGRLAIETRTDGRIVTTVVRDNGPGLSPDALDRIFGLFVQEQSGGGLGIGLSLARQLVELHGGSLSAASAGEGQGSCFTITLPVAAHDSLALEEETTTNDGVEASDRHRVLVVDDNEDAANTFVELLGLLGHEARASHDGDASLAAAEAFRPTVIFLDLHMPGQDGFAVIERLRACPNQSAVFVAALTGYGQHEDRERTRAAGFDAHLTKPVTVERLKEIFAEVGARQSV